MTRTENVIKRQYNCSPETVELALEQLGFFLIKTTKATKHYRRKDGLHVILRGKIRKKHKRRGLLTIMTIHRDSLNEHRILEFTQEMRSRFFSELNRKISLKT